MKSGSLVRDSVLILLLTTGSVLSASPQVQPSPSPEAEIRAEEARLYADAHPYIDEQLAELKKTVRDLGALDPTPSQGQLPDLQPKLVAIADQQRHSGPS